MSVSACTPPRAASFFACVMRSESFSRSGASPSCRSSSGQAVSSCRLRRSCWHSGWSLGATAGQGVVWYTGQFYALFFLQNTLKLDFQTAYLLIAAALAIGTPFFVVFGKLSDRIGERGNGLAAFLRFSPP